VGNRRELLSATVKLEVHHGYAPLAPAAPCRLPDSRQRRRRAL